MGYCSLGRALLRSLETDLVLLEFAPGLIELVLQLPDDLFIVDVVVFSQVPLLLRLLAQHTMEAVPARQL